MLQQLDPQIIWESIPHQAIAFATEQALITNMMRQTRGIES